MSLSEVKCSLPKELMRTMLETMESAVPGLYEHTGKNVQRVKEVFKQHVLKTPVTQDLAKSLNLPQGSRLALEIDKLHLMYNKPDDALRVSEINDKPEILGPFRDAMLFQYKAQKRHCEKQQALPERPPAPQPAAVAAAVDTKRKEPEPSDEELAKRLQAEFDQEVPNQEESRPAKRAFVVDQVARDIFANFFGGSGPLRLHNSNIVIGSPGAKSGSRNRKVEEKESDINLRMNEIFTLPANSKNRKINTSLNCKVTLGSGCSGIRINCGRDSTIVLGSGCSDIKIFADMNSKVTLEKDCQDIVIVGMESSIIIGNNCRNVNLDLGMDAKYQLGDNCQDIFHNDRRVV